MPKEEKPQEWRTAITSIAPGRIRVRGHDIEKLMEKASFSDAVYLLLKGTFPPENHKRAMNAILVSSIDHGATAPSVLACRTVVSGGNPLNAAVAGGVLTIGESHGGAIEACARIFQEHAEQGRESEKASALVKEYKSAGRRMPGFGHRLHETDPRSVKLIQICKEDGLYGKYCMLALAIQDELLAASGRKLPLNVDGAIAAVISEMGFDWRMGKGFFIISRTPGLVAHAFEERSREKPMRNMGTMRAVYDGPEGD
jgi:citryl-CoA lyase